MIARNGRLDPMAKLRTKEQGKRQDKPCLRALKGPLETDEAVYLQSESAILREEGSSNVLCPSSRRRTPRSPAILPPEAQVGVHGCVAGVVLYQRADEHPGRERIRRIAPEQTG